MTRSEDDLEPLLRARRPLFRDASQGDGLEPGDHLDSLIIERARTALRAPQPMSFYRGTRWAVPVALAATVVMSFTLLLYTREGAAPAPSAEKSTRSVNDARQLPVQSPANSGAVTTERHRRSSPPNAQAATPEVFVRPPPPPSADRAASSVLADKLDAATAKSAVEETQRAVDVSAQMRRSEAGAAAAVAAPLAAATEGKAMNLDPKRDNPVDWWRDIVQLRVNGQQAEADAEWRKLQARFPSFLPPSVAPADQP